MGGAGPPVIPRGPRIAREAPDARDVLFPVRPPRGPPAASSGLLGRPGGRRPGRADAAARPGRADRAGRRTYAGATPRPRRRRTDVPDILSAPDPSPPPRAGRALPLHRTYFRPLPPDRAGSPPRVSPGSGPRTGSASPLDSELQSIPRSRTYFRDAAALNASPYRYTGHTFGDAAALNASPYRYTGHTFGPMVVKSSSTHFRADPGPAPHLVFISIQRYTGHSWRPSITLHRTYFRRCTHVKPDILLPLNRTYFGRALPLNRTYHYR